MTRNISRPVSKPGRYGTLYLYRIVYRDRDPASPAFEWRTWAYTSDHALELFASDGDDWLAVSWSQVSAAPRHRQPVHPVRP